MIPAPRPSPERVVPCAVGHRGASCVLAADHAGSCIPAPGHVVRLVAEVAS